MQLTCELTDAWVECKHQLKLYMKPAQESGGGVLVEGCFVVLSAGGCLVENFPLSVLLLHLGTSTLGKGWLFFQSILHGLWMKQEVPGV